MDHTFSIIGFDQVIADELRLKLVEFSELHFLFENRSYEESLNSILKNTPSLIFFDVDKVGIGDPFCFVNEIQNYLDELPCFVGCSSSKSMAYEAIKYNFVDFLLKPLSELEIRKCIMKFQKNRRKKDSEKLCLKSYSDYRFIEFQEILYLKADNNTTDFYLKDGRRIAAYKTLKHYEDSLPENFIRVHNSYIINSKQITRINFGKSEIALQGGGAEIPFSKSYKIRVDHLKEEILTSLSIVS